MASAANAVNFVTDDVHQLGGQAPHLWGADRMTDAPKPSAVLDAIADVVLRYRPKPVSDAAKERKKRAKRVKKAKANE